MRRELGTSESIRRIMITPVGSRVMMPLYGSRLFELVDRTVDDEWVLDATRYIYEAVENNEPRVVIKKVDVLRGDVVSIRILYEEEGIESVVNMGWGEIDAAA